MAVLAVCLSPGLQHSSYLPRLEPGAVNRIASCHYDVSGKAVNAARVLTALGIDTLCIGQGGRNAGLLQDLAREEGLRLELVPGEGLLRSCTSLICPGGQVTELVEPNHPVSSATVDAVREAYRRALEDHPRVLIAGSMAPGFPPDFQAELVDMARQRGAWVAVDLHGENLRRVLPARPELIKINKDEFSALIGQPGRVDSSSLGDAVRSWSRSQQSALVVTDGPHPSFAHWEGRLWESPGKPLPPELLLNPIGCGDAFLAGLAAALEHGMADFNAVLAFATGCARSNAQTARPGHLLAADIAPFKKALLAGAST